MAGEQYYVGRYWRLPLEKSVAVARWARRQWDRLFWDSSSVPDEPIVALVVTFEGGEVHRAWVLPERERVQINRNAWVETLEVSKAYERLEQYGVDEEDVYSRYLER